MEIVGVLTLVSEMVPFARRLIDLLGEAHDEPSPTDDILTLIEKLMPVASALVHQIEIIRTQTEAQAPEVWAQVSSGWRSSVDEWNALQKKHADEDN